MLSRNMRFSKVGASLATLLVALTVSVGVAAKDEKDKDKDKVKAEPFTASAQFTELLGPNSDAKCQPTQSAPGITASGTINGSGLATDIGYFTVSSVDCVRSTNPYALTPPFTFESTAFMLTATNGDQIVVSYSGTAQPSLSGLFTLNGQFTFVSGTGQFRKVKGGGTLTGVEDLSPYPAARGFVTLTGEISTK